ICFAPTCSAHRNSGPPCTHCQNRFSARLDRLITSWPSLAELPGRYAPSGRDAEQLRRSSAEDCDPLVVAQSRCAEHEVDLGAGPREWIVGPDHDLARTGFRDQVAQRLGREHDRVEIELAVLEIRGWIFL